MKKYIRLLRLDDQYPVLGGALAAGIFAGHRDVWIVWWAVASVLISIGTFLFNELIDRQDVDKYSWNPIHIRATALNMGAAWALYVLCTLLGIGMAYAIGLEVWAVALAVLGWLYSVPVVRFKALPVIDICVQLVTWWVIPFLAPLWKLGMVGDGMPCAIAVGLLAWTVVFPYQLADYSADKKAGLHSTHAVLGIRVSLLLGTAMGITGILIFFLYGGIARAWWLGAFPLVACAPMILTPGWMRLNGETKQQKAFQHYVGWMKPLTQLLIPYVLLLWLLL